MFVGARYGRIAKITNPGNSSTMPTYAPSISCGALNKVNDSPSYNEGELAGDDVVDWSMSEFTKGSVTISCTSVTPDAERIMDSYHYDKDGDRHLADAGTKSEYGFAHVSQKKYKSETKFYGRLFPRLSPKYEGGDIESQGGSTTLNPESVPAIWLKPHCGAPARLSPYFDTEEEAKAWVDKMLPPATDSGSVGETDNSSPDV